MKIKIEPRKCTRCGTLSFWVNGIICDDEGVNIDWHCANCKKHFSIHFEVPPEDKE